MDVGEILPEVISSRVRQMGVVCIPMGLEPPSLVRICEGVRFVLDCGSKHHTPTWHYYGGGATLPDYNWDPQVHDNKEERISP